MAGCSEPSKIMKDDVASSSSSTSFKDSLKKDCQLSKKQDARYPSRLPQTSQSFFASGVYEDQFLGGKDEVPFSTTPSVGSVYPSDASYPSRLPHTNPSFTTRIPYCLRLITSTGGRRRMRSKRSVFRESSADIPQKLKQDDSLSFNMVNECDEALHHLNELKIELLSIMDKKKGFQEASLSGDTERMMHHFDKARMRIERIPFFLWNGMEMEMQRIRHEMLDNKHSLEKELEFFHLENSQPSILKALFYCDRVMHRLESIKFVIKLKNIKSPQNVTKKQMDLFGDSLASDAGETKEKSSNATDTGTAGGEKIGGSNTATRKSDFFEKPSSVDVSSLFNDNCWAPLVLSLPHNRIIDYCDEILQNIKELQIKLHNIEDQEKVVRKSPLSDDRDGILNNKSIASHIHNARLNIDRIKLFILDQHDVFSTDDLRREILRLCIEIKCDILNLSHSYFPSIQAQLYCDQVIRNLKSLKFFVQARIKHQQHMYREKSQNLSHNPRSFWDRDSLASDPGDVKKDSFSEVEIAGSTVGSEETKGETLGLVDFQHLKLDDLPADTETPTTVIKENVGKVNVYDSESSVSKDALEPGPDGLPEVSSSTVDVVGSTSVRSDNEETISTTELYDEELELDDHYSKTSTKVIDETGGNINIYDCEITVSPGAVKSPTEFQLTVSDYADDFPDEMLRITPVLECKPSMSFERPVTLRMRTNFCAMDGQRIPAKILYKKGGNNWTVVEHVSLRNRNVVEFQLLHFCKYCCGIDEEFCSQGFYHFYNDVYIQRKTAQITSVFCRNKTTREEIENQILKRNFISLLSVTEEIEVKLNQNIKVEFNCSRTSEVQLKNIKPKAHSFQVTEEILRRNAIPNNFISSLPSDNQTGQLLINYKIILDKVRRTLQLTVFWPIEKQTGHTYNVSTEINNGPVVSKYTVKSGGNMEATEDGASNTITLGDNVETSHSSGGH